MAKRRLDPLLYGAVFTFLIVLYLWPVWWNGWPLIFNDTASYLETARVGKIFSFQSTGYGLFLKLCLLIWHSLYGVVLVQTALIIGSLWYLGRTIGASRRATALTLTILGIISPLPLIGSLVMPDAIFLSGTAMLIALILKPTPQRHVGPYILITIALSTHIATGPLYLLFLFVGYLFTRKNPAGGQLANNFKTLAKKIFGLLIATQIALLLLYPHKSVSIWAIHITAQLVDRNGPAMDELRANCATEHYSLCPYIDQISGISADQFLWDKAKPYQLYFDPWVATPPDWPRLIQQTVKHYPAKVLAMIPQRWWHQYTTYKIGYEYSTEKWDTNLVWSIRQNFGDKGIDSWFATRQETRWFNPMPHPWPEIYQITGLLAHLAPFVLWFWWKDDRRRGLAIFLLAAVLINALFMGTLSHPQNRYQLRIHFLPLAVPLFALAAPRLPSTPLPSGQYKSSKYP